VPWIPPGFPWRQISERGGVLSHSFLGCCCIQQDVSSRSIWRSSLTYCGSRKLQPADTLDTPPFHEQQPKAIPLGRLPARSLFKAALGSLVIGALVTRWKPSMTSSLNVSVANCFVGEGDESRLTVSMETVCEENAYGYHFMKVFAWDILVKHVVGFKRYIGYKRSRSQLRRS
jgi:hypothetical protein